MPAATVVAAFALPGAFFPPLPFLPFPKRRQTSPSDVIYQTSPSDVI